MTPLTCFSRWVMARVRVFSFHQNERKIPMPTNYHSFSFNFAIAIAIALVATTTAAAHPFHVTLSETNYNPKNDTLEIALRVNPFDLERALSRKAKRRIDIDRSADLDKRLEAYVNEHFRVTSENKAPFEINWIGKEISLKTAWLYFEVGLDGVEKVDVTNSLFFELEHDQVNTMNFRNGDERYSLSFTTSRATRTLDLSSQ